MKRVVLTCLPIPDPGEEARRIVRNGMNGILCALSDEEFDRATEGNWQGSVDPVHALVDPERGITLCSKAYDDAARWAEETDRWYARRYALGFPVHRDDFLTIASVL